MKASYRNWLICSDLASPLNIVFRAAGVMRVFGVDCIKKFYLISFFLQFIRTGFFLSANTFSVTASAANQTIKIFLAGLDDSDSDCTKQLFNLKICFKVYLLYYFIFFARNIKFGCKWQCWLRSFSAVGTAN